MILAGDIGGTKTLLAAFEPPSFRMEAFASYPSRDHPSLEAIVDKFKVANPVKWTHACFGVAGPVKHGRVVATNLAWNVDSAVLAQRLSLGHVHLINDLEANANGIAGLKAEDFAVLNRGEPAEGNAAVIAAGTGLGEAGLFWDGERHRPFACEGGHVDFAPVDDLQFELLKFLQAKLRGRVSYERVLSGPGLYNIFQFLDEAKHHEVPGWLRDAIREGDPPAVIATNAAKNGCCEQAVDLFVSIYGAEAGNVALKMLSLAGVYLGGGIAPKILPRLKEPRFMKAFLDKGRMRPLLEAMPVRAILNDKTALLGAARYAIAMESGRGG